MDLQSQYWRWPSNNSSRVQLMKKNNLGLSSAHPWRASRTRNQPNLCTMRVVDCRSLILIVNVIELWVSIDFKSLLRAQQFSWFVFYLIIVYECIWFAFPEFCSPFTITKKNHSKSKYLDFRNFISLILHFSYKRRKNFSFNIWSSSFCVWFSKWNYI